MSYASLTPYEFDPLDFGPLSQRVSPQTLRRAILLLFTLSAATWIFDTKPVNAPDVAAPAIIPAAVVAPAVATLLPKPPASPQTEKAAPGPQSAAAPLFAAEAIVAAKPDGTLLDPAFSLGVGPTSLGRIARLGPNFESAAPSVALAQTENVEPASPAPHPAEPAPAPPVAQVAPAPAAPQVAETIAVPVPMPADPGLVEIVPLPAPRPPQLQTVPLRPAPMRAPLRQFVQRMRPAAAPVATADNRNFIEKLFGMPQQPSGPSLAYATPEAGLFGGARRLAPAPAQGYDQWTAVYDIAAHTVYMPNGARLEAHSGLGALIDDPRYVNARNRGATPPNVYELEPRAQLFHGVQALRLNPVGGSGTYGRNGLLAHTYMLGPNGASNGCVSFRDYNTFLQAYQNGEVRRLVVVPRLI